MHTFTCPVCGITSHHPKDVEEGYCGRCHEWTGGSSRQLPQSTQAELPSGDTSPAAKFIQGMDVKQMEEWAKRQAIRAAGEG